MFSLMLAMLGRCYNGLDLSEFEANNKSLGVGKTRCIARFLATVRLSC